MDKKRGTLFVISGPSGVGKGTVCRHLDLDALNMKFSVSMTTRKPREGEVEGVNYFFVTPDEFQKTIAADGFIEYASFSDHFYGTPAAAMEKWLSEGKNVLLEIETKGALQVMKKCPDACSIFILPPSREELENRLRGRGTDDEDSIRKRLARSIDEMELKDRYKYNVVNADIDRTTEEISEIIRKEGSL
ncbi:MAG: guanylate kinase [Erysipelotrichaceae bacterium]|nr:guanylate kinase [Erysipelotrichaceae bacterium]